MKILATRTPLSRMPFLFEDLGLAMVTASLRAAGFECRFLDAVQENFKPTAYVQELVRCPEEVLCVTIHAEEQADEILTMLSAVKKMAPDKIVILGGHPTHAIDEAIFRVYPKAFDFIVRGDGEDTVVELMRHLTCGVPNLPSIGGLSYKNGSGLTRLPNRKRNKAYDTLPHACRDTWQGNRARPRTRSALTYFSRGCNHSCQFCSVVTLYGVNQRAWASRSLDDFVQELDKLHSQYGIHDFTIVDPNFLGNPQGGNMHARELAAALKALNLKIVYDIAARVDAFSEALLEHMYESGLRRVFIGVESGVQSVLNRWKKAVNVKSNLETAKRLVSAGIYIDTGFIMLTPVTTLAEIRQNLTFLRQLPYFTPRAVTSVLWPIHEAATTSTINGDLLLVDDKKISLSFKFADAAVERYYLLANSMRHAFNEFYLRIYWQMWDHMSDDPAVIHRFAAAMRAMLDVILEIAEKILEGVEKGWSNLRLENAMWKWVDQKSPYVATLAATFQ
jgi:radical SAM superfamily enzyme YgiQ (UPF0313 family)